METSRILGLIVLAVGVAAVVHALASRGGREGGGTRTAGELLLGGGFVGFGAATVALPESDLLRVGAIALALLGLGVMARSRAGESRGA